MVRKHPISTLGIPLVVLAVLIALGIYGVIAGSNSLANSNKSTAYSLALDTSQAFSLYVEKVSAWGTWEAHGGCKEVFVGAWGRIGGAASTTVGAGGMHMRMSRDSQSVKVFT